MTHALCRFSRIVGIRLFSIRHEHYSNFGPKKVGKFKRLPTAMAFDWGYDQHNGPNVWGKYFPNANGTQQSPINIDTSSSMTDNDLVQSVLTWSYRGDTCTTLSNTGNGWKVDVDASGCSLEGGPLQHRYRLEQFHCHWGENNTIGSEHTVDGRMYAAELHLVHWNTDLFESFKEAAHSDGGLAVLGTFILPGKEHQELNKLMKLMKNIVYKGDKVPVSEKISPEAFVPDSYSYWTYQGSLTTPPCYESVTWILFKEPIEFSPDQLNEFRQLSRRTADAENLNAVQGDYVVKNYRPPQTLHNRLVREATLTKM